MFHFKRLGALTLALALAATALTGCGGGGNSSASSSASGSSSQGDSSAQVESIDLAQVTDPYLATSGLPGDTVVARIGDSDITAAEFLYWASYGTDLYLSQFGGYLTSVPWDTDLGGITMAEQMKESSLNAAACYALGLAPEDIAKGVEYLQRAGDYGEAKEELRRYKKTLFGKWVRR